MSIRAFILAAVAAGVALPAAAQAQHYGSYGYNGGGYYADRDRYRDDYRGHDRWERREWRERRRFEAAQRRRWEWQRRHGYDRDYRGYGY